MQYLDKYKEYVFLENYKEMQEFVDSHNIEFEWEFTSEDKLEFPIVVRVMHDYGSEQRLEVVFTTQELKKIVKLMEKWK